MFALGIILFHLMVDRPPIKYATAKDRLYKAIAADRADVFWKFYPFPENMEPFSDDLKSLIISMLSINPEKRPSI